MPASASAFSEREFHAWVRRHLPAGRMGLLPLGDDTTALRVGRHAALLTTDALVEGTHFQPTSPPRAVGRAAAAASLSDIAAKGGTPVALLLDVLLPPSTPARWPRAVVSGAEAMMADYDAHLVGGDTKASRQRCVVGTILGVGDPHHLAPRTAARPDDVVVTTGGVGRGGVRGLALGAGRAPTPRELSDLLTIEPRVREGQALVRQVHAMLDTSDGLAEAAHLLAEASGVRVVLNEGDLPWDPELRRRVPDPARRASVGFFGGDYELLAAIPSSRLAAARRSMADLGTPLTVVGRVTVGRGAWLRTGAGLVRLPRAGWNPFRPSPPSAA